jgi:hypothetical protein
VDSAYAFRRIVCALKGKEGEDLSFGLTLIGRCEKYIDFKTKGNYSNY